MKNLVYKELTFSIHKFFYVLPLLLSLLMFIPNWIFSFVYMYFFWISVPQIIVAYTAQRDYTMLSMLPVSKKDIVSSKVFAFILVEMIHVLLLLIFGLIHNEVYGTYNFFMEINPAFFGIAFASLGIFNIIFFPQYFKTAYKFGKPLIAGVIATLLFAGFFEYSAIGIASISNILKSTDNLVQLSILALGIIVFAILNVVSLKNSVRNFENIK